MEINFNNLNPLPPEVKLGETKAKSVESGLKSDLVDSSLKITQNRQGEVSAAGGVRKIDETDLRRDDDLGKLISAALSFPPPDMKFDE